MCVSEKVPRLTFEGMCILSSHSPPPSIPALHSPKNFERRCNNLVVAGDGYSAVDAAAP